MKAWMMTITVLSMCLAATAFAQYDPDPGQPDTILIQDSIFVNSNPNNWTAVQVPVYFVTDDSIAGFTLPLTWTSADDQVWPESAIIGDSLIRWESVFDSVVTSDHLLRIIDFVDMGGDIDPLFNTHGQRVHMMDIVFTISPNAVPQYVNIDTTYDPIDGRISFWDFSGTTTYVPVFHPFVLVYGSPTGIDKGNSLPEKFSLSQNYPNPFNPQTQIEFTIPEERLVALEIFNILGQKVATPVAEQKPAGFYSIVWNGKTTEGVNVPSGVYFYRLTAGDFVQTKKMIMLK